MDNPTPEAVAEKATKVLDAYETIRITRDHIARAEMELERALNKMGSLMGGWYFDLEDFSKDSSKHTIGVVEVYGIIAEIHKRFKDMYNHAEEAAHEARVQLKKRGSHR